jgi:hypothetical protein
MSYMADDARRFQDHRECGLMTTSVSSSVAVGCLVGLGLLACSGSNTTEGGTPQAYGGGMQTPGGGGSQQVPGGGGTQTTAGSPGTGNVVNMGAGGTMGQPGSGGGVIGGAPPNGGSNPGGGSGNTGGSNPGGGMGGGSSGSSGGGAAGAGGGGTGGGGGVTLVDCNQMGETSAKPLLDACKSFKATPSYSTKLDFGPYGAVMEPNVGKGSGTENTDPMDSATCPAFAALFGEDASITNQLLDVGTQPCSMDGSAASCLNMKLYTVYRPANWPSGKIPVLSWGNGTCAQPEGYGALLRYIASFGFFIVAANMREVGMGSPPPIVNGINFAEKANADMSSPYFGHLDMSKVGVMGHSQGSGAASTAAADSRVKAVILFNGGTSNAKPYLAVSGDLDIGGTAASGFASAMATAAKGSYIYFHNPAGVGGIRGHLVLMMTPQRIAPQALQFWQMVLNGDMTAKTAFLAQKTTADYDFGAKGF